MRKVDDRIGYVVVTGYQLFKWAERTLREVRERYLINPLTTAKESDTKNDNLSTD